MHVARTALGQCARQGAFAGPDSPPSAGPAQVALETVSLSVELVRTSER